MPLDLSQSSKALAKIADALGRGIKSSHFDKLVNEMLGTEMPDRDRDVEEAWELNQRRGR